MSSTAARAEGRPGSRSPLNWLTQQGLTGMGRREALTGYLFILPTYLGFLLFVLGPVTASLGLSMFDWDLLAQKSPRFVGSRNFADSTADARLLTSFRNTLTSVLCA